MVCVPLILFSGFALVCEFYQNFPYSSFPRNPSLVAPRLLTGVPALQAANSGTLIPLPKALTIPHLDLNLGTLAAFTWGGLYVLLEPVAGTVLALMCLGAAAVTNTALSENSTLTNQVAIAVHVICWLLQFVGHGVFEGRAPALLDNLTQAIFLAPLFVWLEFLFKFGYRRELQDRVAKAAQVEIAKFREHKSKNGKAH